MGKKKDTQPIKIACFINPS